MAQGQRLNPAARDAAVRRIAVITTGVVTLGLAGTVGLGVAIAAGTPQKDTSDNTAYEEVIVEEEPAPATVPAHNVPTDNVPDNAPAGAAGAPVPTQQKPVPTQQKQPVPTQQKQPAPAPKPRATTKAPQTQSGGS